MEICRDVSRRSSRLLDVGRHRVVTDPLQNERRTQSAKLGERLMRFACLLAGFVLASVSSFASDINLWVVDANGEIGLVDVTPGAHLGQVTLLGPSGVNLTDIAFDPS